MPFADCKQCVGCGVSFVPGKVNQRYCRTSCRKKHTKYKPIQVTCEVCGKLFQKEERRIRQRPGNYCNRECASKLSYDGNRSRPELLLERLIQEEFPEAELVVNTREVLSNSLELDLYLPEAKLAIEVNGPTHYRPIYGEEKLVKTIRRDKAKMKEAEEQGIFLVIIDVSSNDFSSWGKAAPLLESIFYSCLKPSIQLRLTI